jgi:general secretion pathway protein H
MTWRHERAERRAVNRRACTLPPAGFAAPAGVVAPAGVARPAGFTLIEVIVTLAILGLALALITGYKPPWSSGLGLKGTATELASGLRLARSQAILRNRQVALDVDLTRHRYRVGDGAPQPLPSNLAITLLTVSGENRGRTEGNIRFNPDGSSTGGRISLADGQRRIAVGVDWLTGRVSVADVR